MHIRQDGPGVYDDWDLIFRGFVDAGQIFNNRIQAGESNYQLLGTGAGVELAASRHFDVRIDGAYALKAIASPLQTLVEKDSFRLHVIATLSW
jgi:hemolysin activation/secretion protein